MCYYLWIDLLKYNPHLIGYDYFTSFDQYEHCWNQFYYHGSEHLHPTENSLMTLKVTPKPKLLLLISLDLLSVITVWFFPYFNCIGFMFSLFPPLPLFRDHQRCESVNYHGVLFSFVLNTLALYGYITFCFSPADRYLSISVGLLWFRSSAFKLWCRHLSICL